MLGLIARPKVQHRFRQPGGLKILASKARYDCGPPAKVTSSKHHVTGSATNSQEENL